MKLNILLSNFGGDFFILLGAFMFVIVSYDVHKKRVNKVHKTVKKYLNWIQNSVFEGELTMGQIKKLKKEIDDVISPNYDSVVFYIYPNANYISKKFIGIDKSWYTTNIL